MVITPFSSCVPYNGKRWREKLCTIPNWRVKQWQIRRDVHAQAVLQYAKIFRKSIRKNAVH